MMSCRGGYTEASIYFKYYDSSLDEGLSQIAEGR